MRRPTEHNPYCGFTDDQGAPTRTKHTGTLVCRGSNYYRAGVEPHFN